MLNQSIIIRKSACKEEKMVALSGDKKRKVWILSGILAKTACTIAMVAILVSCGGSSENKGYSYTVGGTVNGLVGGGLVLQNNGGDDLAVSLNGSFSFAKAVANGGTYSVTVKKQPSALCQTCTVRNDSGTINTSPVYSVSVSCLAPPPRLVVDPSGKYAYAANYTSNNISGYKITDGTGALTPLNGSPFAAGTNPNSITIDPTGKFVYVTNYGSHNITIYTIDTTIGNKGALINPILVDAGANPYSITIIPSPAVLSGKFAYVTNTGSDNISIYPINPTTGDLGAVTTVTAGTKPYAITIDPSGEFAYVLNAGANTISVYPINQATGVLDAIASVTDITKPSFMIIDPSGKYAYALQAESNTISIYLIDDITGALGLATAVTAGTKPYSLAIIPSTATLSGKFAYAANVNSQKVSAYAINAGTGLLTEVTTSPFTAGTYPYCIAIDRLGEFAYALNAGSSTISVYQIDQTTGALIAGTPVPFP
jgi:6-phosphogluconolactonase